MADKQERISAGFRDIAARVEALFPADERGVALSTVAAIEELREIITSVEILRTGLAMQERTLQAALEREAKQSGSA